MKNNMITLKAPKTTPAQRQELKTHKQNLEEVIRDIESDSQKVGELRKKEKSLEKESASLHHAAAQFDRDAEIKLAATLKQIERIHEAIHESESRAHDRKEASFQIINQAQELVSKLCQATYQKLLDQIGSALAPYYSRFDDARHAARNAQAVSDMGARLLAQPMFPEVSIERIYEVAKDALRKVDALLTRDEIYSYQGCEKAEKIAMAA